MPTLKEIRRRVASVKKTQQITRAMNMVAAAKLRRAQTRGLAHRPFLEELEGITGRMGRFIRVADHPLLVTPPDTVDITLIVLSTDRGLCGGLNSNLFRAVEARIRESREKEESISLAIEGRKGKEFFRRRDYAVIKEYTGVGGDPDGWAARESEELINAFLAKRLKAVEIAYPRFHSMVSQVPTIERLLPMKKDELAPEAVDIDYLYEPGKGRILETLLPRLLRTKMCHMVYELQLSEHAARMVAMDAATRNAEEMVDRLTLDMNKARQAAITKELIDIVGGTEALK